MKAFCSNCRNETNHTISKEDKQEISSDEHDYYAEYVYQIIKCNGCENMSFREVSSSNLELDMEDGTPIESVTLYPPRSEETLLLKSFYNAPHKTRSIYRETMDAFNNGMYILCSAGLRAIIESICNNEGILNGLVEITKKDGSTKIQRQKDLRGKIAGLHEK